MRVRPERRLAVELGAELRQAGRELGLGV